MQKYVPFSPKVIVKYKQIYNILIKKFLLNYYFIVIYILCIADTMILTIILLVINLYNLRGI